MTLDHDRIAGREWVIHFPTGSEVNLKELGKAGFDKQPLSYGAFSSVPVTLAKAGAELLLSAP